MKKLKNHFKDEPYFNNNSCNFCFLPVSGRRRHHVITDIIIIVVWHFIRRRFFCFLFFIYFFIFYFFLCADRVTCGTKQIKFEYDNIPFKITLSASIN
jgi:hypothetical protein